MIKKEIINSKTFNDVENNAIPSLLSDDYMCEKSNIYYADDSLNILREIDKNIKLEIADKLANNENFTVHHKINNRSYLISFISINNVKGMPVAYIFSYKEDRIVQSHVNMKFFIHIITLVILVIIAFFILQIMLKSNKIKESEIQLRELNATKDKLFSIIAHDLRSPFNGILGFSELLIENVNEFETAETEKYLGIINSSAKNTLVLLDNLLDWAKTQTGQINFNPEKLILSSIIHEVIETSNSMAKIKGISLNYIKSDKIEAFADENMLKIVLRNLISNAIKFTKVGGKIRVYAISKQGRVEITISDNGVGMNDETQNSLFSLETNETTMGTANEKGSGLGLVLCKEFVEKLGGNIWVESEEGKGSNFKFTLPLHIVKMTTN